jgi:DNA repair protein RadC
MKDDILLQCFSEEDILAAATKVMEGRVRYGTVFDSPMAVKDYLRMSIGGEPREHFKVIFLDAQHRMIEAVVMFSGTLSQTSVYPREVVKKALEMNAAAVILSHNHPSGSVEPSRADEHLTQALKSALTLIDVRVLDHIIVSPVATCSFAERGLL